MSKNSLNSLGDKQRTCTVVGQAGSTLVSSGFPISFIRFNVTLLQTTHLFCPKDIVDAVKDS